MEAVAGEVVLPDFEAHGWVVCGLERRARREGCGGGFECLVVGGWMGGGGEVRGRMGFWW